MSDDYVKSGALIKNFRETNLVQKYDSFLFHGKSEHKQTKKNALVEKINSSHARFLLICDD